MRNDISSQVWQYSSNYGVDQNYIGPGCIFCHFGFMYIYLGMFFISRAQVTFHSLMIFLAILDLSYLVISICFFALPELSSIYFDNFYLLMVPYGLPIGQIFLTGSIYSTLALTTER